MITNGTSPSACAVRDQEREWVQKALASLDAAERRVLELRYVANHSFAEIAAMLELGLSAVKMRHLRALKRLRGLVDGRIEECDV